MRYCGTPVAIAALLCFVLLSHPIHAQSTSIITETERPSGSELRIRSIPDGADVTINGRYIGRTPLNVRDLASGTHRVRIEKSGYVPVDRWVRLQENSLLEMDVVLEQRVGILSLDIRPDDADVTIDGLVRSGDTFRLPVGEYTLHVARFGYRDHRERVTIRENRTVVRRIRLEPAPFDVSAATLSQPRFNPDAPGPAGILLLNFEVTAPGEATVRVLSPDATEVFRSDIPSFSERRQRVRWDGRGPAGEALPDGSYRVVIEARGEADQTAVRRVLDAAIDRSRIVAYRSTLQGTGGALFAPDTVSLPAGNFQVSAGALAPLHSSGALDADFIPGYFGLRAGVGAGLELTLSADGFFTAPVDTSRLQAGAGIRWTYAAPTPRAIASQLPPAAGLRQWFTGAVQLTALFGRTDGMRANPYDTTANWPSVRLGLPTGIGSGPFRLVVTPELVASLSHPDAIGGSSDEPVFWSYARAALFFDRNDFSAALSTALRTQPFGGDTSVGPGRPDGFTRALHAGVELHQILPNTPFAVSLSVATHFESADSRALLIGGGMGILY